MKSFLLFFFIVTTFFPTHLFSQEVKKPSVSGTFYPSSKGKLVKLVDMFINNASKASYSEGDIFAKGRNIMAVISPHAGYVYSGHVAGYAYSAIKGAEFKTVVLIGPSHHKRFDGMSVYNKGEFETPLGNIEVDAKFANALIEKNPKISFYRDAYLKEHSLEVQLPFLQRSLRQDFKIVPILIGNQTLENCKLLAKSLVDVTGNRKDILLVASTDLSHYHNYKDAVNMDDYTLSLLKDFKLKEIFDNCSNGKVELCGSGAVITVMMASRLLGADGLRVLKYANSGDVTYDKSRVVGYVSCIIGNNLQKRDGVIMLDDNQKNRLLSIARGSIESYLKDGKKPSLSESDPMLLEKKGAFVTLTRHGQLRGCIGSLYQLQPLYRTISDMAVEAAFSDPRFPTLSKEELNDIKIEISVLSKFKEVKDVSDIEVGTHGLLVRKGFSSGLLLPQVAAEYNWTRDEFLEHTCYKAGLDKDAWKKGATIYMFSAFVFGEEQAK